VSYATSFFHSYINAAFPDLISLFYDSDRWLNGIPPWIEHGATRLQQSRVSMEMVEGPIGFDAATIRLKCPACSKQSTLVVINTSFLAIASHILWHCLDKTSTVDPIRELVVGLTSDAKFLREHASALPVLPLSVVVSGVSWIMSHELGHAVGGASGYTLGTDVPSWCKEGVENELHADGVGIKVLEHRIDATPWAGPQNERHRDLSTGIELILRTMAFTASLRSGSYVSLDDAGSTFEDGSPSPSLRWKVLSNRLRLRENLDFLGKSLDVPGVFESWDNSARAILETLNDRR